MKQLVIFPNPVDAHCELSHDTGGWTVIATPTTHSSGTPAQVFTIPDGTTNGHGAWLRVTYTGKNPVSQHGFLFLNDGVLPWPWPADQTAAWSADVFVLSPASGPLPLEALQLKGRSGFYTSAGLHVPLVGATGFRLVELVESGHEAEAVAFLQAIGPGRVVRVLTMAHYLFQLPPVAGVFALTRTLDLARAHGVYLSVVCLADTKSFSMMSFEQHVHEIGQICDGHPACAFVEIGNELYPLHPTQDERLEDVMYLEQLRALIPATVPVSLGSTHGPGDESDIFKDGDLLTIHGERSDDGTGWRWVRHTNEQRALADRVGRYAVNDEPRRDDLGTDKHLALAIFCRMMRLGDTFHFKGGLQCEPPVGGELTAFEARQRGWAAIPADWEGIYQNAGFAGSPVKSFTNAVRVYSSVRGSEAYTLVMGAEPDLFIEWRDDWPSRTLEISDGGCQLWKVGR